MVYRETDRTRSRAAQRRERLLAAAESIVSTDGFSTATVAAVAKAAGVSTGAVYTHFPSKAELLAATFRRAAGREFAAVQDAVAAVDDRRTDTARRLSALVEVFTRRALRGRRLAWSLLVEPVDPLVEAERLTFRMSYRDLVEGILRAGISGGEVPEQDPKLAAAAVVGAIGEALVGPLSPIAAYPTPEAVTDPLRAICLRAVGIAVVNEGSR
ncbi:TetR/AcrR family transcriptional regulator [Micromonospora sp. NPDC049679]|uniref:TetR/AcrR family transcriptional regulator n=1 Tax=Micromonospora sp. NPDC049679 TaxID=3155920 RepID=UPI0034060849